MKKNMTGKSRMLVVGIVLGADETGAGGRGLQNS